MKPLSTDELKALIASRTFWYHQLELAPGIVTPGMNNCASTLKLLTLPDNMHGMRVLDIGAAEGFFTYECERRGAAEIIAVDYSTPEHTGFTLISELLESRAQHRLDTIYNLRPEVYGQFDVVLFLGILYHLPDPTLALHIVRRLCKPGALMFLESHVIDDLLMTSEGQPINFSSEVKAQLNKIPLMQYYSEDILNRGDATNFWGPNMTALRQMLLDAEFKVTSETKNPVMGHRGIFNCQATEKASSRKHLIDQAYGKLLR